MLLADNHLFAVDKPACLPVVPDASGDASLLELAKARIARERGKPGRVFLGVVHRLDRPVSGAVLFARTSKAAARLGAQFRERCVEKRYVALSASRPANDGGVIEQWLAKDSRSNRVRAVPPRTGESAAGARRAVTRWRLLGRAGEPFAIELRPETGRPHQLRCALAALGAPILGDLKYGAATPLPDRSIALHALALELEHPTRREPVALRAPLPERPWWRSLHDVP